MLSLLLLQVLLQQCSKEVLRVQVSPGHPMHFVEVPASPAAIQRADCLDAMKNAIHREAVPVIMPYIDELDSTSWWMSQALEFQVATGCLSGFNVILGGYQEGAEDKAQHSDYPRGLNHANTSRVIESVFGSAGLMPTPITGLDYQQGDCTGLGGEALATDLVYNSSAWMESAPFHKCLKGLSSRFEKYTALANQDDLGR